MGQDLRGALRAIARYPIAASVAVLSLALGIGATTATLTVRNVVFHKPPPLYRDPARLSRIQLGSVDRPIGPLGGFVPGPLFAIWSDARGPAIAAATPSRGVRDVRTTDRTDTLTIRYVTPNFFALLGVAPLSGSTAGAVLSYRAWRTLFDERPDAIGSVVWIDNEPHTVSGIAPRRFWFSEMNSPIWLPLDRERLLRQDALEVIARRSDGVTPDRLAAELDTGLRAYAARLPADQRQLRINTSTIEGTPLGANVAVVLPYVLGASVLLTLVIAVANVAILMIAQWTVRDREIAIRASLGASRSRIVRALLAESMLLSMAGGALGICATVALQGIIVSRGGLAATFFDLSIDAGVLTASMLAAAAAGIGAGLAPALFETRRLHANPLSTLAGSDRVRQGWRHALVVVEMTVTVALLVETSAMIDGYHRARETEMGFRTRPLMSARVDNAAAAAIATLVDAAARVPGVASAAAATTAPYNAAGGVEPIAIDAHGSRLVRAERVAVTPEFFSTLGVPLRVGRGFAREDTARAARAIVSESLAARLFAGRDPIGERIWIGARPHDVVGIAADYLSDPLEPRESAARVFVPLDADARSRQRVVIVVRAAEDPAPLVQPVRRAIQAAAGGAVVAGAFTFDQIRTVMGQEILVGTAPLAPLVAVGMLLTLAGIYGVLAFAIARRSRELAVRAAIGATRRDLVQLVASQSVRLVALAAVLGVAVTVAVGRIVRANGGAGTVFDAPWTAFVVPVLLMVGIAAIATWAPARRAVRIDPAVLLRSE